MTSAPRPGDTDLAAVGAALGGPARAKILLALGDGRSLPASVLAAEAGVAPSTATHHLAQLLDAGLVVTTARGRFRYYALAGPQVGELIEAVARLAPVQPVTSLRQGTRASALRYARSCYGHLAGRLGVVVADALCDAGPAAGPDGVTALTVSARGATRLGALGVDGRAGEPLSGCLDWTEQRHHVGGALGRAVLGRLVDLGWLARAKASRALTVTEEGRRALPSTLGVTLP